jgi:hypothetical protein
MRKAFLLLVLAAALFVAKAISQEIVIEPTNGHATTANHAAVLGPEANTRPSVARASSKPDAAPARSTVKRTAMAKPAETKPAAAQPAVDPPQPVEESLAPPPEPRKLPDRPQWAATAGDDSLTLQAKIANALARDPNLSSSPIQVRVDDSAITLEGHAAGGQEHLEAQRLAQSYAWNRKVIDHVEVGPGLTARK